MSDLSVPERDVYGMISDLSSSFSIIISKDFLAFAIMRVFS
jgi:hypothetical protein